MKTLSLDLRERILAAYDQEEGTREEVAHRFRVSLGMVKKPSSNGGASDTSGRAPRGERVHASAPVGHWQTITLISSIRLDGSTPALPIEGGHRYGSVPSLCVDGIMPDAAAR